MAWFSRIRSEDGPLSGLEPGGDDPRDSPEQLMARQLSLVQLINSNAGSLPPEAVVISRGITDTIRGVIDTASERQLDISAVVSINGIVDDYLPTTLRAYLNLDPALTERASGSGRTPRVALREQLDSLSSAADDLLEASQRHDVDSLLTQGNFLRVKFSGSDLDL